MLTKLTQSVFKAISSLTKNKAVYAMSTIKNNDKDHNKNQTVDGQANVSTRPDGRDRYDTKDKFDRNDKDDRNMNREETIHKTDQHSHKTDSNKFNVNVKNLDAQGNPLKHDNFKGDVKPNNTGGIRDPFERRDGDKLNRPRQGLNQHNQDTLKQDQHKDVKADPFKQDKQKAPGDYQNKDNKTDPSKQDQNKNVKADPFKQDKQKAFGDNKTDSSKQDQNKDVKVDPFKQDKQKAPGDNKPGSYGDNVQDHKPKESNRNPDNKFDNDKDNSKDKKH